MLWGLGSGECARLCFTAAAAHRSHRNLPIRNHTQTHIHIHTSTSQAKFSSRYGTGDTGPAHTKAGPARGRKSCVVEQSVEPSMQARAASPPFDGVSLPRPFVCEEEGCGKRFLQSGGLVRHRRTHTGEKPNVCGRPGCSERFACLNSAHVKPFACDYPGCSKCFAEPWNLVRHKRSHTGIYGAYKYTPPPEPSQYTLVNACLIANSATPAVPPYLPQSSKSAKNYNAIEDGLRLAQALFDSIDGAGLPDEQQPRLDRQPACTQSAPASRSSTKRVRDSDGDSVLRLAPDGDSVLQTIVPIRKRQAIREFDDWLKATAAVDGGS